MGSQPRRQRRSLLLCCLVLITGCGGPDAEPAGPSFDPLLVTTTSLPTAVPSLAYSASLAATGGDGTYAWALSAGSLPTGLSLAATGEVSGTPTGSTGAFTARVTSGDGQTASQELTIAVNAPLILSSANPPNGVQGEAYHTTLVATGGDGSTTWSVSQGSLPAGLSLGPATGVISGIPTNVETGDFTVEVASGDGQTAAQGLSIGVYELLAITTTSLVDGVLDIAYGETVQATGGDGNYGWSLVAGVLPAGLSQEESTGEISGTPAAVETQDFVVAVTSNDGQTVERALSLTILAAPPVLRPTDLCSGHPTVSIATFEDPLLEAGIRTALGVGAQVDLTCTLISGLTALDVLFAGFSSLVGLQNLTGLTEVAFRQNAISDLTPLSGLTRLTRVDLDFNSITDLSPLSGLTGLTWLRAGWSSITDLSPLSGLTGLTFLALGGNGYSDLSPVSGLTALTQLFLWGNPNVSDIRPLSSLTGLTTLWLNQNSITDVSALSGLTSLSTLRLHGNANLGDIQPLLDNAGLGAGDFVTLAATSAACTDVLALKAKGVSVTSSCPPPPGTAAVSIGDNFFDPVNQRVAAGGTVQWTWAGGNSHNVTFSDPTLTSSATQTAGTFDGVFPDAGVFDYMCTVHGSAMSGVIVVE